MRPKYLLVIAAFSMSMTIFCSEVVISNPADSALLSAVTNNSLTELRAALKMGPSVDAQGKALRIATAGKSSKIMRELLRDNSSSFIDLQNQDGNSALMIAAQKNYMPEVRLLLKNSANPTVANTAGKTAYELTTLTGIKKLLEKAEKAISAVRPERLLFTQFQELFENNGVSLDAKIKKLTSFLAEKPSIYAKTELLQSASTSGIWLLVNELVKQPDIKEFINIPNSKGWTALMFAASQGQYLIVKELLLAGADPSQRTELNKTAIDLTKERENDIGKVDAQNIINLLQRAVKAEDKRNITIMGYELETIKNALQKVSEKATNYIEQNAVGQMEVATGISKALEKISNEISSKVTSITMQKVSEVGKILGGISVTLLNLATSASQAPELADIVTQTAQTTKELAQQAQTTMTQTLASLAPSAAQAGVEAAQAIAETEKLLELVEQTSSLAPAAEQAIASTTELLHSLVESPEIAPDIITQAEQALQELSAATAIESTPEAAAIISDIVNAFSAIEYPEISSELLEYVLPGF